MMSTVGGRVAAVFQASQRGHSFRTRYTPLRGVDIQPGSDHVLAAPFDLTASDRFALAQSVAVPQTVLVVAQQDYAAIKGR